jgi:prepilin-type N-terminal cleavage/methylation domain-containing protein/prepilin-type processing-associated H-X9-DG protein
MQAWIAGFRRAQRGFSLVEVLMCISIIAVLTALLVPAARNAKERTKSTVCMNNLRQIGQGMMLYAADRGSFPYASHYQWWVDWAENMIPYIAPGKYVWHPEAWPNGLWQETTTWAWIDHDYSQNRYNYFTCPAGPAASAGAAFKYPHNYGCNEWLMPVNHMDYFVGGMPIPPVKPARVLRPGSIILVHDVGVMAAWANGDGPDTSWQFKVITETAFIADPTGERGNGQVQCITPTGNDTDTPLGVGEGWPVYYRHNGRCNAAMADGHVESFPNGGIRRRNWVPPKAIYKDWGGGNKYIEVGYP